MHNSESGAHRSPVAVAQKVTRVIKQTGENQHFLLSLGSERFDEGTYFYKIIEEI